MEKMNSLVEDIKEVRRVSSGKTGTLNQINQRTITNPYSYHTILKALRHPFPDAYAIAKMITIEHDGMYDSIRDLIRIGAFDVVIPIHSVSPVVCDAVESLESSAKVLIFSSTPYDPATYLPPSQTWNLTRALSTFPHVSAYSSRRPENILVGWHHQFWKWLDTWFTQRAWDRSGVLVNEYREKRGLEPIAGGYIGYQRRYPSLVVGGVPPFLDESYPISPQVTVVGTLDDIDDAREPIDEDLNHWLNQAESRIVYIGFGTGTKLNENEAANATGHLYRSLLEQFGEPVRFLFALRGLEQERLRKVFDFAFGSQPSSESKRKLEYMNGHFRIQDNVPQAALLDSGKVNVFVSHMGMGGFTEGSQGGVPFVCCPSGCDQFFNTARAIDAGIGVRVSAGFADLSDRVMEVLQNKSMQERSKDVAHELQHFDGKEQAQQALENLISE